MARLGLKLYYLRTRVRQISQQQLAAELSMRQATLSHVERGRAQAPLTLLMALCHYFDVTPTWLLDEESGLEPGPAQRWSMRNGLVTTGMSIELDAERIEELGEGRALVTLSEEDRFFDAEAADARRALSEPGTADEKMQEIAEERAALEARRIEELEAELQVHPRKRRASRD